ncbi:nitrate reductase molybdenum cofactor assembly chaperone [Planctomycetota bacterium]
MSHVPKVLDAFARLLSYPDQHTAQAAELLYIVLQGEVDEAASEISKFGSFLEQSDEWQVEEAFTGTFDVNPACALEVGWHLFGEEYARGMFLVRMREELRKYDLPESAELTDHIAHVLAIVAAMPDDQATSFVKACVQPAIEKMNVALAEKDSPYRHIMAALSMVLEAKWGASKPQHHDEILKSRDANVDPLHAFPVAEVECGSGCGSGPEIVPLEASFGDGGDNLGVTDAGLPADGEQEREPGRTQL